MKISNTLDEKSIAIYYSISFNFSKRMSSFENNYERWLKYIEYRSSAGGGKEAIEGSPCEKVEEGSFKFFSQPADHMRLAIVEIAVLPDQAHLLLEDERIGVVVVKQALPNGPEVDGLSHYIEVVRNVELDWIDRV